MYILKKKREQIKNNVLRLTEGGDLTEYSNLKGKIYE